MRFVCLVDVSSVSSYLSFATQPVVLIVRACYSHSGVPRPAGIDPSARKPLGGLAVSDTRSEEGESLFRSPVMCASSYS